MLDANMGKAHQLLYGELKYQAKKPLELVNPVVFEPVEQPSSELCTSCTQVYVPLNKRNTSYQCNAHVFRLSFCQFI